MLPWQPAYVGIGSNLGDPRGRVLRAFEALADLPDTRLLARSPLYVTPAFGPVSQPDFVNAVAGLLTRQALEPFFGALRALETDLGRTPPRERWGPREIDLDLLVFGAARHEDARLTVPHPGIAERDFVLHPLCDVAPDLEVPGVGRVWELARSVVDRGVRRLD
ncbi:MAG: 2-amino-4-hydroxy-6-hydroxymethyldihydropteridine diphosphokinase [Steroidobacteraceae bacterium]|jgi:2-amino-4-hydroxy-6-hydroxymethyldihydropteridine diphosphokinase|nr:2-amino-4-hydroxy-6-hydroxymethyldihydropteridine diphosphokinase [Steroidobacteraceae bacterium]